MFFHEFTFFAYEYRAFKKYVWYICFKYITSMYKKHEPIK